MNWRHQAPHDPVRYQRADGLPFERNTSRMFSLSDGPPLPRLEKSRDLFFPAQRGLHKTSLASFGPFKFDDWHPRSLLNRSKRYTPPVARRPQGRVKVAKYIPPYSASIQRRVGDMVGDKNQSKSVII
jgi:hypothetical protein